MPLISVSKKNFALGALAFVSVAFVFYTEVFAKSGTSRDFSSQLYLNFEPLDRPTTLKITGGRNQVCAVYVLNANQSTFIIPKIATDENLIIERFDATQFNSSPISKEHIGGLAKISSLPKVQQGAIIYQLPIRTYFARELGSSQTGKISDLDDAILAELVELKVDYLWLTGVLEHADQVNSDPDVVKGNAGSYYAIRDMWDINGNLGNFDHLDHLIERAHQHNIRIILDWVVNHTARQHSTDVLCKNDLNFGSFDRRQSFFDPQNNYFYLQDPFDAPDDLQWEGRDGLFDTELNEPGIQLEYPARVTGNDVTSASPSLNDWYETAKLNYGFNFTNGHQSFEPIPRTWFQMKDVAAYWLKKGIDGFRIDFAHVVPKNFWQWVIPQLKEVQPNVFLLAEAYENFGFNYEDLFSAGIDSVYQSELYWGLHRHAKDPKNIRETNPLSLPAFRPTSVEHNRQFTNYMENHDEIRLASAFSSSVLENRAQRAEYGRAMTAYQALMPANLMIHGGQEIQEDAAIEGPFSRGSGRTSIFDFVYQEEVLKWLSGIRPESIRNFRDQYRRLLALKKNDSFASAHRAGHYSYYDLDATNWQKDQSKWIAAYVRVHPITHESYLVAMNAHPTNAVETTLHWTNENGVDSFGILNALRINAQPSRRYRFVEVFAQPGWLPQDPSISGEGIPGNILFKTSGIPSGLYLGPLAPRTTYVFRIEALN